MHAEVFTPFDEKVLVAVCVEVLEEGFIFLFPFFLFTARAGFCWT